VTVRYGKMLKYAMILVCIVCVVFFPLVTAESVASNQIDSETIVLQFSIKDFTNNFTSEKENIGLDSLSGNEEILEIPTAVKKFELVTFDQAGMNTNFRSSSPHISFQIDGIEYPADLKRMDFESIDDGIDSYSGTLTGEVNSSVLLTISDNATIGSIALNDETYYIEPVEIKTHTEITKRIPHIIYSSKDVEYREFLIDNGPIDSKADEPGVSYKSLTTNPGIRDVQQTDSVPDGRTAVTVLIVTDNQFYSDHSGSGWKIVAQDIIAEANRQFGREDIGVILVPSYNDSKRQVLSQNPLIRSDPFFTFGQVYPETSLNENSADLGLYLGGYDKTTGDEQGLSDGYGNVSQPYYGRHSWAQMVEDKSDHLYPGTTEARRILTIHELGHQFGAHHDDGDPEIKPEIDTPGYNRATSWPVVPLHGTVMWHWYIQGFNTYEFSSSSPGYHGDAMHDNALRIHDTKGDVADYVDCSATPPSADFTWAPNIPTIYTYQKLTFIDNSANGPTYRYWDFGNGGYSTDLTPEFAYIDAGTYTVRLTAANCAGSSIASKDITISRSPSYVFLSGTPQTGSAPLKVVFNSEGTTPPPESWNWSFGDGKFSEESNPQHTYDESGSFTVILNVIQDDETNTEVLQNYINVAPQPPHAGFTASRTNRTDGAPLLVQFNDTSTNDPNRWSWNFGDGGTSYSQNASHTYLTNGTYTVSLTAINSAPVATHPRKQIGRVTRLAKISLGTE